VSPLSVPQLARPDLAKPDPTRADATRTDATRVGAIAPPDPALMEVSAIYPDRSLPKIGADGRMPMTVYAGAVDPADTRPRIAILLSDIGMSDPESKDAIATLPAAMSLAFSPYADLPASLLLAARARGHESLVAVPMEPQNAPLNDAGPQALLTGVPTLENIRRLEWVLTRMTGYVGATGGLGRLHGERFAASSDQMTLLLDELGQRGLLYINPIPPASGQNPVSMPGSRGVDLVIDAPALRSQIDSQLAQLEQLALRRGSAMGLVDDPAPMTVDRLRAWSAGLAQRGIALVPVSALVIPPAPQPATALR
jgi:polysaccharide deacetylase 2 family uncharacterized protein YibQ